MSEAASPSQSSPRPDGRIPVLDGLRLVAALMVVAHHWIGQGSTAWEQSTPKLFETVHPMAAYGWMGVNLFFLISGFVICMSSWGRSLGQFFSSRVARLYPSYWVAVLVTTAVVTAWPVFAKPLGLREVLVNLTMFQEPLHVTPVDYVYWTLSAELRFYVLFALFVVWRGVTFRRAVLFCVLWTAASLVAPDAGAVPGYLLMPEYSMYFVAGVALFLLRQYRTNALLWGTVLLSWVRALAAITPKLKEMSGYDARTLTWTAAALLITGFFVVMAAIALGAFDRVRWRGLVTLGGLTYPLYLLHEFIGWTVIRKFHTTASPWLLLAGLLVVMLGISYLVYALVDRPAGTLVRRLLDRAILEIRVGPQGQQVAPVLAVAAPPERSERPRELG